MTQGSFLFSQVYTFPSWDFEGASSAAGKTNCRANPGDRLVRHLRRLGDPDPQLQSRSKGVGPLLQQLQCNRCTAKRNDCPDEARPFCNVRRALTFCNGIFSCLSNKQIYTMGLDLCFDYSNTSIQIACHLETLSAPLKVPPIILVRRRVRLQLHAH